MAEALNKRLLAIFGQPVENSLSPRIHRAFARQADLSIPYAPLDTGPADFAEQLEEFRQRGGIGCNITVPLKQLAFSLSRAHSHDARQAEAVTPTGRPWAP